MVERKNIISPRLAFQDGVAFELQNVLESLRAEMVGAKAVFVPCPVCESQASVPIIAQRPLQEAKCRHCHNELKFKLLPSGKYKVRSALGLEYVIGAERIRKEWAH